jgi:hypothetical protein
MAAEPTSAKALQSWEDAFQYPIPVVRKLEKRLRADVEENREKLRTLVGSVEKLSKHRIDVFCVIDY